MSASAIVSSPQASQGSNGIVPSLCFFIEKMDLQSSRVLRVTFNTLIMPYKQEGNTQNCYHKLENTFTIDNYKMSLPDLLNGLRNKVREQFAQSFQACDRIGHNAYYAIAVKAEIECLKIGIDGEAVKLIGNFERSCEGSLNRGFRFNLLGASPQSTSLLIEGLDIAVEPIPKSDDERRRFLLMP